MPQIIGRALGICEAYLNGIQPFGLALSYDFFCIFRWVAMPVNTLLSPRIKGLLWWFFYFFAFLLLFRIAFWISFHAHIEQVSIPDMLQALYIGVKFDLRIAACWTAFPFLLGILIHFPGKRLWQRRFWLSFFLVCSLIQLGFYAAQFGVFSYLQTTVSAAHIELLKNWSTAVDMVWQSYPIIPVAAAVGILLFMSYFYWERKMPGTLETQWFRYRAKSSALLVWSTFFILWAGAIYGKFAYYPLRWSEAFFSIYPSLGHFATNPLHFYFDTLRYKTKDFDKDKLAKYWPALKQHFGLESDDFENADQFTRKFRSSAEKIPPYSNVVILLIESLATYKTGLSDNPLNPTPFLDTLASNSLYFDRFFVSTQATARSVFTTVTGIPDMSLQKTGSRNPFMVRQQTIFNDFSDHKKMYFLGGSANWGNIRGIFSRNVSGVEIYEEGDYREYPRVDVWGVSDYHLFEKAHKVFQKQHQTKRPFLALVQTSGFHRPYTIPDFIPNFKEVSEQEVSEEKAQKYGFHSLGEYNAMRLQDYSLAHFFHLAEKANYFKDTLFVILGDHGLPEIKAEHIPPGYRHFKLTNFHVPLLFYSPERIDAEVDSRIAWQPDIMPTVASMLGIPYETKTLGRDLFQFQRPGEDVAFVYSWYKTPEEYMLVGDDFLFRGSPGSGGELFRYLDKDYQTNVSEKFPKKYSAFQNLANGLFYASKYLMYHNN